MEDELLDLLRRLESIEEDHSGLGETNVREHMMDEVLSGFLRVSPGFLPSGEYGLSVEANARVAEALGRFCKAATVAAKRERLDTFHQRLAAFLNPNVRTAGGADFGDYFGYHDPDWFDESGRDRRNEPVARPMKKTVRRAYVFDRTGNMEDLLLAIDRLGIWSWRAANGGPMGDPSIEARPEAGIWVQVRDGLETLEADGSYSPPEYGFMALLEAEPDRIDIVDATFRVTLDRARATNITEASEYDW